MMRLQNLCHPVCLTCRETSVSNDQGHDKMPRSQLSMEQHKDPNISALFDSALDEKEIWHFDKKMASNSRRRVGC